MLFSGGRGSGALTTALVQMPGVALTVVINGYDDGASTGEVRRFLGDALGPSDFRKNASRLARALRTCPVPLVDLLDRRLPAEESATGQSVIERLGAAVTDAVDSDARFLDAPTRTAVVERLRLFSRALQTGVSAFDFQDCSVGNLVFAGAYLRSGRRFNPTVDDYCALVGLPAGLIENVTDGTDAHLVAVDLDGRVLAREAEIVDATRRNRIREIFLLPKPLSADERAALESAGAAGALDALASRSVRPSLNPRLGGRLADADLIVYAPGTQHSSLFPSYLTAGLSDAIAANLRAVKLLITNIQTDAEIAGSSAVDIVERAVFYLKKKGRVEMPTPALVTHYLLNRPGAATAETSYVPLGRLDALQDPRLVRVGQYEEGTSGRHDAAKVLTPFVGALLARRTQHRRIGVVLYDAWSTDKLAQTLLEMVRGGLADLPVAVTAICQTTTPLDRQFVASLPFSLREVGPLDVPANDRRVREILAAEGCEYVVLFESSGMYNGEDVPWLVSHLTGRLDAVWGSRRLSVRDIEESYRLKYRHKALLGAISYAGSHALSLLYLALYGRYVSDTLSGARAIRVSDAAALTSGLTGRHANQHLLSRLLGRKAEMFEVPVHFYSLSPQQVKRTSVADGLRAIGTILWNRLRPVRPPKEEAPEVARSAGATPTAP